MNEVILGLVCFRLKVSNFLKQFLSQLLHLDKNKKYFLSELIEYGLKFSKIMNFKKILNGEELRKTKFSVYC
jgi:hypothetical protein